MKKVLFGLVLAAFVAGGVFAQEENEKKNGGGGLFDIHSGPTAQKRALFVDLGYTIDYLQLGGFGVGLGWEQRISNKTTWLINAGFGSYSEDYGFFKISTLELSAEVNMRYYFFGTALDKFFVNVGAGFGYFSMSFDDETSAFGAINIPVYAGWKFIFGPGFFAELDIGYRVGIGIIEPDALGVFVAPSYGGLMSGVRIGWAF